jgi:hypothetical protein
MENVPCACGCGRAFAPDESPRGGRPRRYFSNACRKRAQRGRRQTEHWIRAVEGDLHVQSDPPTQQIANTIVETAVIAGAFRRLAIQEPNPVLSAGCEKQYLEILAALDRNFPGWSA